MTFKSICGLWGLVLIVAAIGLAESSKSQRDETPKPQAAKDQPPLSGVEQLMWMNRNDALAVVKRQLDGNSYEERKNLIEAAAQLVWYHDAQCHKITSKELTDEVVYYSRLITETYPQITFIVVIPWLKTAGLTYCKPISENPSVKEFMKKSG